MCLFFICCNAGILHGLKIPAGQTERKDLICPRHGYDFLQFTALFKTDYLHQNKKKLPM